MYVNRIDQTVYDAQAWAFEGTPVFDHLSEHSCRMLALEVVEQPWWTSLTSHPVKVGFGNVRMHWGGLGGWSGVRFNARGTNRYTVPHELAHVLQRRLTTERGHGERYRGMYVWLVAAVFGQPYASMLDEAFEKFDVPAQRFDRPIPPTLCDIDALSIATQERGGWRRP